MHLFVEDEPPGQTMARLIDRFNATHPAIRVDPLIVPSGGYGRRLSELVAANTPPDLAWDTPTARLMASGKLVPVDSLTGRPGGFDLGEFPSFVVDHLRYQGRLWAMPFELSAVSVGVNRDHLAREGIPEPSLGWRWEDMLDVARRTTHPERKQWGWGNTRAGWQWFDAIVGAGGRLWNTDVTPARSALSEPATIDGIARYAALWTVEQVTSIHAPVDEFNLTGSFTLWPTCVAVPGYEPVLPFRSSATSVPLIQRPACLWCWKVLDLFRTAEPRIQAAWQFVSWFYQTDNLLDWSIGGGYLPITRAGLTAPRWQAVVQADPAWKAPLWQIDQGYLRPPPLVPEVDGWYPIYQSAIDQIVLGQASPTEALPVAARAIDDLIKQGKCLGCV